MGVNVTSVGHTWVTPALLRMAYSRSPFGRPLTTLQARREEGTLDSMPVCFTFPFSMFHCRMRSELVLANLLSNKFAFLGVKSAFGSELAKQYRYKIKDDKRNSR